MYCGYLAEIQTREQTNWRLNALLRDKDDVLKDIKRGAYYFISGVGNAVGFTAYNVANHINFNPFPNSEAVVTTIIMAVVSAGLAAKGLANMVNGDRRLEIANNRINELLRPSAEKT